MTIDKKNAIKALFAVVSVLSIFTGWYILVSPETVLALAMLIFGLLQSTLGPDSDWVESFRDRVFIRLHELLSLIGGYATLEVGSSSFIATIEENEECFEEVIYKNGYHRNVLAGKKYRTSDGEKVYSISSWVHRESLLDDKQGHLTIFEGTRDGTLDLYHHYETSWVVHPIKHYFSNESVDGDPHGTMEDVIERYR